MAAVEVVVRSGSSTGVCGSVWWQRLEDTKTREAAEEFRELQFLVVASPAMRVQLSPTLQNDPLPKLFFVPSDCTGQA